MAQTRWRLSRPGSGDASATNPQRLRRSDRVRARRLQALTVDQSSGRGASPPPPKSSSSSSSSAQLPTVACPPNMAASSFACSSAFDCLLFASLPSSFALLLFFLPLLPAPDPSAANTLLVCKALMLFAALSSTSTFRVSPAFALDVPVQGLPTVQRDQLDQRR